MQPMQTMLSLQSRQMSMVLKKRPRSVPVNKYKLKTKKAAQKRFSMVRLTKRVDFCLDWKTERPWVHVPLVGSPPSEPQQVAREPPPSPRQAAHDHGAAGLEETPKDASVLQKTQVPENLSASKVIFITKHLSAVNTVYKLVALKQCSLLFFNLRVFLFNLFRRRAAERALQSGPKTSLRGL
jgi:hypothetical protein